MNLTAIKAFIAIALVVGASANFIILWMAISDYAVLTDRLLNGARGKIAVANIRRKLVRTGVFLVIAFCANETSDAWVAMALLILSIMHAGDAHADWYDRRYLVNFIRGKRNAAGDSLADAPTRREGDR